jgi:hypothetical protein
MNEYLSEWASQIEENTYLYVIGWAYQPGDNPSLEWFISYNEKEWQRLIEEELRAELETQIAKGYTSLLKAAMNVGDIKTVIVTMLYPKPMEVREGMNIYLVSYQYVFPQEDIQEFFSLPAHSSPHEAAMDVGIFFGKHLNIRMQELIQKYGIAIYPTSITWY